MQKKTRLMDDAQGILRAAPCSVELPAGAGKTHLLCTAVARAAGEDRRSLILTHTNAGVDAITRRLRDFQVPQTLARVETIASWAFALVRAYSRIGAISISDPPDWTRSDEYTKAARLVVEARAIQKVLESSYDHLFVDEYQDCSISQHELILAMGRAIASTVVLGDPLQAIFGFAGPIVDWQQDVVSQFPPFVAAVHPHRWSSHNQALGAWLLDIRSALKSGGPFDLAAHDVDGLTFISGVDPQRISSTTRGLTGAGGSVVLLDRWAGDVAKHASRMGGHMTVMEDINGNFMRECLSRLSESGDPLLAHWLAGYSKACLVGLSGIDRPLLGRLQRDQSVGHFKRTEIEGVVQALDALRLAPSYAELLSTAREIATAPGIRIYRREAWFDTLAAIEEMAQTGEPVADCLGRIRAMAGCEGGAQRKPSPPARSW